MELTNNSQEITSINIDNYLEYLHDSEKDDQDTWNSLQQALHMDVLNYEDKNHHKYKLPKPKEFHSFCKNIYFHYKNPETSIFEPETVWPVWRLLYQVQGKVMYKIFDGFFAELYFNIENHYLLLVIKGTSSKGNLWSDIKNVGLGLKGGELDSSFTFGEKVRLLMNKFKCKPILLITGHSLGGYLAQIISYTITYCFVDDNGKVKSRKEPMDDFGIYTVVFDSPAALKQISSIDPRDPIQFERFRLPIVNFVIDANIINSNSLIGPHLGQLISVKEFKDLTVPSKWERICKAKSAHGIRKFQDIDLKKCRQVEYLPHRKTIKYEEKEIQSCFFSPKNCERLHKYLFLSAICAELVNKLPNFQIFDGCIFLKDESVYAEEFIPKAHFFLSQFKEKLDSGTFDAKNLMDHTIYEIWKAEMLAHAHNFCLNEKWKNRVQVLKDGTKICGFKSFEEMRFVGCLIHNSFERCIYYDFDQFNAIDPKILENLTSTSKAMLILIVRGKNQKIIHRGGEKLKILYLVLDEDDTKLKLTFKITALEEKSLKYLKNSVQLEFLGNQVSTLEIFGSNLLEELTIWEIYNFHFDAVPTPHHFYSNQSIRGDRAFYTSVDEFALKLLKDDRKFVLISSNAGMGKSAALRHIALIYQQKLSNYWIVHIDLFNIQGELSSEKDKLTSMEAAAEFVRNLVLADRKNDEVLSKVFNWKLQMKDMIFLFDSLDEVCPFHRETVEQFIKLLRKTELLIILATRPHEGNNFRYAFIAELKCFNQKQSQDFVIQKFKMLGKKPPSDPGKWLDNICDRFNFWSLPLNVNMATLMFDPVTDIEESKGLVVNRNINEMFIAKSIENTLKIKFDLDKIEHKAASMEIYKDKFDKFNELFEILAVCLIFHRGEIKKIRSKKIKNKIKEHREFINRSDLAELPINVKNVHFLHRSYAEYLVAKLFIKCHQKDQCLTFKLSNEQIKCIYMADYRRVVREHICIILASSPSKLIDFVPLSISNKKKLLEVIILEDCYELYLQVKIYITFAFKYSIFGFNYPNDITLLYLALQKVRPKFVQQLIKDGAKFEDILNEKGVLHLALEKGLHQEVKEHFEHLKPQLNISYNSNFPLHFAAKYGSRDMIEFLIKKGAGIDGKSFRFVIELNNGEVCELLIAKGADCTEALNWAAEFGRIELFNLIYKNTPHENKVERVRDAHFEAAYGGNLEIFQHICGFIEANPLALKLNGDTFLHCAARNGHLEIMPIIFKSPMKI